MGIQLNLGPTYTPPFNKILPRFMSEEILIIDDSGDREFFTVIPNHIINHSSANDQALYIQMKRYAGETGKCFATQETLMKKLHIGFVAYQKSLRYLLKKEWISFAGYTPGKTRPVKTYKINNIWKLNSEEYKKIPAKTKVSLEEGKDNFPNKDMIPAKTKIEEELNYKKKELTDSEAAVQSGHKEIMDYFYCTVRDLCGIVPVLNGKDGRVLKSVLKTYKVEDLKQIVDYYLHDSEKVEHHGYNLSVALSKDTINKWLYATKRY